jgi:hypothetical protein
MKSQAIIAICFTVLTLATIALWLRVRSLEVQSKENAKGNSVFKLIENTGNNGHTTNIGVPWDVERAMMGDAAQRNELFRPEPIKNEVSPTTPLDSPPRINLDNLNRESDSN